MSGYPLLDVFWTISLFFCLVLWIFLVAWILIDVFRSPDIGGWAKAGWTVLVILVPWSGCWHTRSSTATTCSAGMTGT